MDRAFRILRGRDKGRSVPRTLEEAEAAAFYRKWMAGREECGWLDFGVVEDILSDEKRDSLVRECRKVTGSESFSLDCPAGPALGTGAVLSFEEAHLASAVLKALRERGANVTTLPSTKGKRSLWPPSWSLRYIYPVGRNSLHSKT